MKTLELSLSGIDNDQPYFRLGLLQIQVRGGLVLPDWQKVMTDCSNYIHISLLSKNSK